MKMLTHTQLKNFRRLLSDYEKQVKQARNKSRARYKVWAKVSNNTLHTTLKVYDYVHEHKGAGHVEVAEACNLAINTEYTYRADTGNNENTDGFNITVDLLTDGKNDRALQQRYKRVYSRRCSQSVRRHLDAAEDYIQNVVKQSTFPKRSIK